MAKLWLKIRMFLAKTYYVSDFDYGPNKLHCIIGFKKIGDTIYIVSEAFHFPAQKRSE